MLRFLMAAPLENKDYDTHAHGAQHCTAGHREDTPSR